ncbi:hypothetical protein Taro_024778 [Colocasia esculenta]|uniref:Senescence regulator n=1 Tax=Colocasia esculenta TaxID=4460 RepID=A0A843V7P1_COLES|nr:hypothetical protein [Colocasia esculenta]
MEAMPCSRIFWLCNACRSEKLASRLLDAGVSVGVHVLTLTPAQRPGLDAKTMVTQGKREARAREHEEKRKVGFLSPIPPPPRVPSSSSPSLLRFPVSLFPAATRMIPHSGAHADSNEGGGGRVLRWSAPVNIPHWPKKYTKKGPLDGHRYKDGDGLGYDHEEPEPAGGFNLDDDADDEDGMVPPHEWIARKLARSQISSFSMCEGAGTMPKGRDLRKVRNAVLTRTGFLEL